MRRLLLALACAALLLTGCGLGPGKERGGGAQVRVTRDFGQKLLGQVRESKLPGEQTVMRFLRSHFTVDATYGGRFVQKLEGLRGKGVDGQVDWFYFVNGVEASIGAAAYKLSPGDVVQWDYRSWGAAMRVPAIVGSYPEPFLHGKKGKKFPVRLECDDPGTFACREVERRLGKAGVLASGSTIGAGGAQKVTRMVVAPWKLAKLVPSVAKLDREPKQSGVFARFADDGRRLDLLGPDGRVARTAPPGSGLVAAFEPTEDQTVWVVTGPDQRAVNAASKLLDPAVLRDAFAVAATPGGPVKLPVGGSS